jgi:hypothetical protein
MPGSTSLRDDGGTADTVEIIGHLGHRILTQTEPLASGWRAESWVVRIDDPDAQALSAGGVTAPTEEQAVREAQEQARVVIELSIEDQALLDDPG